MFDPSDTIVALATPPDSWRHVVRISGPKTWTCCQAVCQPPLDSRQPGIQPVQLAPCADLTLPGLLYTYPAPRSYTGEDVIEIHVTAANPIVESLLEKLLAGATVRRAGPGEFTARAYLNGKLDLAQAEAVYEIIHSSNRVQLEAAQGLLHGHLGMTLNQGKSDLLHCLGLLEVGLDFSQEDIEVIQNEEAIRRLRDIQGELQQLRQRGLHDRETLHLPSVGIAGAPNAGKSSLFNALLGRTRSLVSPVQRTTRDVLAARLSLPRGACLLFDCAGLLHEPDALLDQLAQQAALESLRQARVVLFCADATHPEGAQDRLLQHRVTAHSVVLVGTKHDLLGQDPQQHQATLEAEYKAPCLLVSATTQHNLDTLIQKLDQILNDAVSGDSLGDSLMALTARHRHALDVALENLAQAIGALEEDQSEVAALFLRTAYQHLGETTQHLDEAVLGEVFSHFCIGK